MYAVIKSGGKQYRITEGETLRVERLPADVGSSIDLNEVLMIADGSKISIGAPFVKGGKVSAEVTAHGRGEKVHIVKFRRRKHYMKRAGHRQDYTELKITGIKAG